eukprot:3715392-Pyramimonas_sp.AAC.1
MSIYIYIYTRHLRCHIPWRPAVPCRELQAISRCLAALEELFASARMPAPLHGKFGGVERPGRLLAKTDA